MSLKSLIIQTSLDVLLTASSSSLSIQNSLKMKRYTTYIMLIIFQNERVRKLLNNIFCIGTKDEYTYESNTELTESENELWGDEFCDKPKQKQ